jgi:hypothetical protein
MPRARVRAVSALVFITALTAPAAAAAADISPMSPGKATVDRVILDHRVNESSGLADSRRHRGVLYTHNDSGDRPRIYAIGPEGATKAVLTISGASARDWEDIAAGPKETLWIADIGDNAGSRTEIQLYRVHEPANLHDQRLRSRSFRLVYPDGSHDAEALLVRPDTGRVFIASKQTSGAAIYRAPKSLRVDAVNHLTRVRSAPARVTAGDFAPDGERLVLRDQLRAYLYRNLSASPRVYDLPDMPQGESAAFGRGGRAMYFGSERVNSTVWRVPLR